jgi:ATP synthase subunit 6
MFWMISDIFSSFDPFSFNSINPSIRVFIIINIFLIILIQLTFWLTPSRSSTLIFPFIIIINAQLLRTYINNLKGLNQTVSTLFFTIITINLLGLIPYFFSTSRHLIFTLIFGLPLWFSIILSRFFKSIKKSIAHFLPDGAPDWLNPFLVLIETTRVTVRPITLSFRLAANIRAGHIVLGLIGIYCAAAWFNSIWGLIILLSTAVGYILFEVAICLIQAYIFCLLLSLYSDDHAH